MRRSSPDRVAAGSWPRSPGPPPAGTSRPPRRRVHPERSVRSAAAGLPAGRRRLRTCGAIGSRKTRRGVRPPPPPRRRGTPARAGGRTRRAQDRRRRAGTVSRTRQSRLPSAARFPQAGSSVVHPIFHCPLLQSCAEPLAQVRQSAMLCQPHELNSWMENDRKLVILDLRSPAEYEAGHIVGALNIDVSSYHPIIRTEDQRIEATRYLVDMFRSAGVDNDSTVVLYQNFTGWAVCRAYWMLDYLGHAPAQMLDGGYRNWLDFGGSIQVEVNQLPGGGNLSPSPRPQILATADYLRKRL
ncbi:MAG: hypothetical protein F4Y46_00250, partial [Chloroflexi bacterium]|nr:hypothetical protein [Chloroflexota bacterium]